MTTTYHIKRDDLGYYVTDGLWHSDYYPTRAIARLVLQDEDEDKA